MRRRSRTAAALAALLALAVSSAACEDTVQTAKVTFRTVVTDGIAAHTLPDETRKKMKIVFDEDGKPQRPAETTSVSMITHHYDTTIPEILVGGPDETEETKETVSAETEKSTTAAKTAPPETTSRKPPEETPSASAEPTDYAKMGENGILVIRRNGHYMGLMGCWGTYSLCESWAKNVNRFKRELPDVNVYQSIIPTSSEFYVPAGFEDFTGSQKNKIEYVAGLLENVADADVLPALSAHTDEHIYSRTDHHWMPLGAYYAAQVFAKAAGTDFPDISEYKKVTAKNYVGSLYGYSRDVNLYNDPEDFDLYIPPNNDALKTTYYNTAFGGGYDSKLIIAPDGSSYYCSFLGSDDRIAKIETDCGNGRTLVIFKESYGNGLVPFLTSSFETIYVCDIRYFDLNAVKFCKDVGATDLYFAVCTFTAAGTNGNYLGAIIDN